MKRSPNHPICSKAPTCVQNRSVPRVRKNTKRCKNCKIALVLGNSRGVGSRMDEPANQMNAASTQAEKLEASRRASRSPIAHACEPKHASAAMGRRGKDPGLLADAEQLILAGVPVKEVEFVLALEGTPVSAPVLYDIIRPYWDAKDPRVAPKHAGKNPARRGGTGGRRPGAGRPPGSTPERVALACSAAEMRQAGTPVAEIMRKLGRSDSTVRELIRDGEALLKRRQRRESRKNEVI